MQRRNIVDFRRQARSGLGGGGGVAPPPSFTGIVDTLLAAGDTVNFAVSCGYQLTTAGGNNVRVRRASDNVEADIAIDTTTHLLDAAALAAHCTTNDGFIVTLYDRSGNARDYTNATTAEQPKIYDGATGIVLSSSLPVATLNGGAGATGNGDGWARGDSAGYTGNQAFCIFFFGATAVDTYTRCLIHFGGASGTTMMFRHDLTVGDLMLNREAGSATGTSFRTFTEATAVSTLSDYIIQSAAAGQVAQATLEQRGSALAQSSAGGTATFNTGVTASAIGANMNQAMGMTGSWSCAIGLNALPSAAGLTALRAFGATLRTTAGV